MSALLGFLLSVVGTTLGIVGVLMMARSYHPFSLVDFARQSIRIAWKFLREGRNAAIQTVALAAKLGELNSEDRTYSLLGLHLIFLGFCLQLLGLALTFIPHYFS